MHRHRRCAAGALVLLALLVGVGCGDDDGGGGEASSAFCTAKDDLDDRITELRGFELTSEDQVPEARERVLAVIAALRTMLDAAPEEIRADADVMASGLDEAETRIEEADAIELGTEVPALLAQIGGVGSSDRADAVKAVNDHAADSCD